VHLKFTLEKAISTMMAPPPATRTPLGSTSPPSLWTNNMITPVDFLKIPLTRSTRPYILCEPFPRSSDIALALPLPLGTSTTFRFMSGKLTHVTNDNPHAIQTNDVLLPIAGIPKNLNGRPTRWPFVHFGFVNYRKFSFFSRARWSKSLSNLTASARIKQGLYLSKTSGSARVLM
jgi:hypothetical protein